MNKRIQELIKEAGFITWEDEPWGPGAGKIDWASDYSKEMELFVKRLVQEMILCVEDHCDGSDLQNNAAISRVAISLRKEFL
jgi:hypothetical protein